MKACCAARAATPLSIAMPAVGDWVARDFKFHTGETMPELKLHDTTVEADAEARR